VPLGNITVKLDLNNLAAAMAQLEPASAANATAAARCLVQLQECERHGDKALMVGAADLRAILDHGEIMAEGMTLIMDIILGKGTKP
jgi:hypothetical protein